MSTEYPFGTRVEDLPRLCAIALREIAARIENGQIVQPTLKAFIHHGPMVTVLDDPNEFGQYELTVQIPVEAVPSARR